LFINENALQLEAAKEDIMCL